jgi:hypothetical protein
VPASEVAVEMGSSDLKLLSIIYEVISKDGMADVQRYETSGQKQVTEDKIPIICSSWALQVPVGIRNTRGRTN